MFLQELVNSPGRVALLTDGLSKLSQAGYFEAALELALERAGSLDGPNLLERTAVQRGFSEGYKECVKDLYHFIERYVNPGKEEKPSPDYGTLAALVDSGDLTKEEADELKRIKSPRTTN